MNDKIINVYKTLELNNYNQSTTAETLGCSRQYVNEVIKRYGKTLNDYKLYSDNKSNTFANKELKAITLRKDCLEYIHKHNITKIEFARRCSDRNISCIGTITSFLSNSHSISQSKIDMIYNLINE